ncbi:MAG: DUF47 domain-containing protein [Chloroflexota bacterium]
MNRFLLPRDTKFFDLLEKSASNLQEAGGNLLDLFENFRDITSKAARMTDFEHEGDAITHEIVGQLHRTFVTPLDREDIANLAERLDDVADFMEGAVSAMRLYNVSEPRDNTQELARILVAQINEINKAVPLLRHRSCFNDILNHCVEINRLENEADAVVRVAMAELFQNGTQVTDIIKWREIYEHLENAADRCEDVANVLEGVVLSYA